MAPSRVRLYWRSWFYNFTTLVLARSEILCQILAKSEACIGYFGIRDIGLFLRDTGIFVFFILGYGIFRNLGYGIFEFILGYELN